MNTTLQERKEQANNIKNKPGVKNSWLFNAYFT